MDQFMQSADPLRPDPTGEMGDIPVPQRLPEFERQLQERLAGLGHEDHTMARIPERLRFWIDGAQYMGALNAMREALLNVPRFTPLPFSPTWLMGLFPLRTDLVTLVDLRLLLDSLEGQEREYEHDLAADVGQALLVGEPGRLVAFRVDRIGEISTAPNEEMDTSASDSDVKRLASSYVERIYHGANSDGGGIIALNLTSLYVDVLEKLEVWARDV
ncbi:MAG TPA: chemotaxis protein CheW [Ktedonobacterales bacterium]